MQTRRHKIYRQSGSKAFLKEGSQILQNSAVWHELIRNGRIGARKFWRFFIDIRNDLNNFLNVSWQKSGTREAIQKGAICFRGIRKKAALNLNVSPTVLSLIRFIFLAQIIVLPLSSALSPSLTGWIWGGILFSLFLLFLMQKNVGYPEMNSGFFIFWILISISALLGTSFKVRTDYYIFISLFLTAGWLTGRALTRDDVRIIMKYTVYGSLLWTVLGIIQKISGVATPPGWVGPEQTAFITIRVYSIFKNPNVFALYLIVILIWAYYLRLDAFSRGNCTDRGVRVSRRTGMLLSGVILLDLIALYYTYSRIAWLIAGMLFLYWTGNRMNYKKWLLVGGAGIVCFILLFDLQSRISSAFFTNSTVWQRLYIWKSVGEAIKEYGWWGAGPGNFNAVYAWFGSAVAPGAQHAHNQYLQIWLENGFFSLIAFFAIIKKGVPRFFGEDLIVKATGLSLAAFLIYGLTDTWTASPFLGGLFWLMMGFGEACARARHLDVVHEGLRELK